MSSGSGCQLSLTYTPAAAARRDADAGLLVQEQRRQTKNGIVNIPYRATTNDTIAGTPNQSSLAVVTGSSTR